jgi:hypothetical protein
LQSQFLYRYLEGAAAAGTTPPSQLFSLVLDVMLKLRQLPKLVSKLLLHVRSLSSARASYHWPAADLDRLGTALTQLPRVQQLEIWKTLNYHLEADCSGQPTTWVPLILPLLKVVFLHSTLADHNVPSTLLTRVQDLAEVSLSRLHQAVVASTMAADLYYEAGVSLLQQGQLLLAYRNLDISGLKPFRDSLVAAVLKQQKLQHPRKLSLPALQVLIHCLQTDGSESDAIWKAAGGELLASAQVNALPLFALPPVFQCSSSLEILRHHETSRVDVESPRFAALVLYYMTRGIHNRQQESSSLLATLAGSSHLWSSPEFWPDLDSELGRALQALARQLQEESSPEMRPIEDESIQSIGADFCRLAAILPLEHLPRCLKMAVTLLGLNLVYSQTFDAVLTSALGAILARCMENTDIFRYMNAATFLLRLLGTGLEGETALLSTVLPLTLTRFTKTLVEITAVYPDLDVQTVAEPKYLRRLAFLTGCLEQLPRPILDSQVAGEKRDAAASLAAKINKTMCRLTKSVPDISAGLEPLLFRAAVPLVKIYGKAKPDKIAKYIRRLLEKGGTEDESQKPGCGPALALYSELMSLEGNPLDLPEDWKQLAWTQSLNHLAGDASVVSAATALAEKILTAAKRAELVNLCADLDGRPALAMTKLLLACSRGVSDVECKRLVQARLDSLVTSLLTSEELADEQLLELVGTVVGCPAAAVTSGVEVLALAALTRLPPALAARSLALLVAFVNHRPNISTRHIPLVCSLVRQHLHHLERTPDTAAAGLLQNLFGLMGRKREDWANVAPYLMADVLNSCLSVGMVACPQVKQELVLACHCLMDICVSQHSYEYLSARLPPATNELFKVVLQNYRQHHKFTGRE